MKLIRPLTVLIIASVVFTVFTGCGEKDVFAPSAEDKKTVMKIAGDNVEFQEYRYFYLNNKRDSYGEDAELSSEDITELQRLTADNIKNRHTLSVMADEYDVKLSDEDEKYVDEYVENYRAMYEDDDSYLAALNEQYITDDFFRKLTEDTKLAYAILEKMKETGVIETGDEAVESALASDDVICIKEIYVSYPSKELRDYAYNRISEAYDRLKAGESFEALMAEYSSYSDTELPYEYGYYTMKYDALDEIWTAAVNLGIGEYSEIVESQFGFHIVLRCEKNTDYMEENRDTIFENYTYSKFYEKFYKLYDTLKPEFTDYGSKLDFATLS